MSFNKQVQQVATQAELEQVLTDSEDALVVVDFTATWCLPCQKIAPEFAQLSEELTDVVFLKVDVDENEVRKMFCFARPSVRFGLVWVVVGIGLHRKAFFRCISLR